MILVPFMFIFCKVSLKYLINNVSPNKIKPIKNQSMMLTNDWWQPCSVGRSRLSYDIMAPLSLTFSLFLFFSVSMSCPLFGILLLCLLQETPLYSQQAETREGQRKRKREREKCGNDRKYGVKLKANIENEEKGWWWRQQMDGEVEEGEKIETYGLRLYFQIRR